MKKAESTDKVLQRYIMQGMMGNKVAQDLAIQLCYFGEDKMPSVCEQWLYAAAVRGDERSRIMYSDMAIVGRINGANWAQVEQWAGEMVKDNPANGYYILAGLYSTKGGAFPNEEKMVKYLKLSDAAGDAHAAAWLAEYYYYDNPDEMDIKQVRKWLEKCVASPKLESPYSFLVDVCDDMEDYDASMRYLKRWIKEAPKELEPCMRIAFRYLKGKGVRKNEELALKYFEKGAYLGDDDAMYYAGFFYRQGMGCRRNIRRAVEYFVRAADAGHARACGELGELYCRGEGVSQDVVRGIKYFELGVEREDGLCCVNMADMYYYGRGVEQDTARAAELMDKARENLNSEYENDLFVELEENARLNGWPITAKKQGVVSEKEMQTAIKDNDYEEVSYNTYRNIIDYPGNLAVLHNAWFLMLIRELEEERLRDYVEILREQAETNAVVALMVGDMYYHRVGVKRNAASAMIFYRKALKNGVKAAAYLRIVLGLHEDVLKGGREAVPQWLAEMPAEMPGMAPVWYMMGLLHSVGLYVEQSADKAAEMFAKAAAAGFKRDPEPDLNHWQNGAQSLRDCVIPNRNW